jgi:hypothetical protein
MKKGVILILLFIAGVGRAQENVTAVPYTTVNGHIFVTATEDGIEGRYLLDTGAPMILMHSRAVKGHGKEMRDNVVAEDTSGNKTEPLSMAEVWSLQLGAMNVSGPLPFIVLN